MYTLILASFQICTFGATQCVLIYGCLLSATLWLWELFVLLPVIVVYSFSLPCNIPLCEYTPILHLTVDGCSDCFWNWAIMNCVAMNILVFVFWLPYIHISVGYLSRSGIAVSEVLMFHVFWRLFYHLDLIKLKWKWVDSVAF